MLVRSPGIGLLLLLVWTGLAAAQEPVRGRVVSASDGSPVPGVRVVVGGTRLSTLTDDRGEYSLSLPAGARTLVFRSIGYRTLEVAVDGRTVVDVSLEPAALMLEEVVVTGYTTQQRRDVSDATAGVSGEQIRERQVATLEEALRGRVAGVQISGSGEPGRPAAVVIRGQNFLGNPAPLYVVDGMYLGQNPNLNPDDIESIEVLKDASAAAQYGAQAANGVVIIRTRRGHGDPRVQLRSYYGFQKIPKRVEMMNTTEWAALAREAYQNAGVDVVAGAANPPPINTDWQDAVFTTGAIQDHNVSVSGGTADASYLLSGGYLRQDGAIIETGFRRYSFRVNSQIQRGRLTLGENLALSNTRRQFLDGFPLIEVVRFPPAIPVYDGTTTSGFGFGSDAVPTFGTNPVGAIRMRDNRGRSNQVIGTAFAELRLFSGLRYRFDVGVNYEDFTQRDFIRQGQLRFRNPLEPARLSDTQVDNTSLLFENLLTFDRTFREGAHRLNAVAGYTEQRQTLDRLLAYREGFDDEGLRVIDAGDRGNLNNAGSRFENALRAFLVRANYVYKDRYLLTASLRRDGSSRFSPGRRYGTFGAASAGWVMSEEGFYESLPVLGRGVGYFKLRASHGVLGNQDIGDYRFSDPVELNLNYLFGTVVNSGATQITLANPNIRWQSNRQTNIGLDLGLLDDRLAVTADYYISDSDGLLVEAPIPWSLGVGAPGRDAGIPVVNAGSIRNTGFELGATHRLERGDFQLNTTLTLTTTSNRVLELGNGGQPIFAGPFGVARTVENEPIGTFWVLKTDGIFQSDAEVLAHGAQPGAKPGDVRYVDLNRDGRISDADRYDAGNAVPDLTGGLFLNGHYRRFDFAISLQGSTGGKIFNVARYWTDRMDDISNFRKGLQPWSPANPSTTTPRAVIGPQGAMNANPASDRWIESGSFLRIQNASLGYRVPGGVLQGLGLSAAEARIYVNLQNLHTFTGFSNWDPETLGFGNPLARGIDDGAIYPNPRTITFGLDIRL
jgi:TonB-dependent starch-binding outer membrane protein SusC